MQKGQKIGGNYGSFFFLGNIDRYLQSHRVVYNCVLTALLFGTLQRRLVFIFKVNRFAG